MATSVIIDPIAPANAAPALALRRSIEIPPRTVLVAIAAIGGVWLLARLWPVVLVVSVALILVGTLNPIVGSLQRRGLGRGMAVSLTLLILVAMIAGIVLATVPALWNELARAVHNLPALQEKLAGWLERSTVMLPLAESVRHADPGKLLVASSREAVKVSSELGAWLGWAATSVVLAVYMLLDHERSQGALYAIVPRRHHLRLARVLLNLETIVGGYMRGQILTSAAIGLFVFIVLTIFGIENAIAFAVFAAVADVIPFVGGAITLVPIAVAALPHGTVVTFALIALIIGYQELENRVLSPYIYGRVLRLNAVAVTIALVVGGQLMGILGALLALPIAAGLRMLIHELRLELPGQPPESAEARAVDARAEETYAALTAGTPAAQAAVIAVAIADEARRRGPECAVAGIRALKAGARF
jgi:putative heme transporter